MSDAIQSKESTPVPVETQYPYRDMGAILYARVSTDDKGQTTETQIRELREWCERNHVRIIAEYEEEESGGDLDRRVFDSVLGRIARGGVDLLLARDPSRLSRDGGDMEDIVSFVGNHSCHIRYSSADGIAPEDDNGKLLNKISTWQGEIERKKLKANTKKGMYTAKENGVHCGRMLAFCFAHRVVENRNMVNTDPKAKQQTVIQSVDTIMAFADEGMSYIQVARELLHVSPQTLRSALIQEELYEDYRDRCAKARGRRQQVGASTRVTETPEIASTRGEGE